MLSIATVLLALAWLRLVHAQNAPLEDPTFDSTIAVYSYKSRPDLSPTVLTIDTSESGATRGQIMMAPYQAYQNSAVMYDMNGEVIWFGFGSTGSGNAHNFQVCEYNGNVSLCWTEGLQYLGYSRGQSYIVDTNLNPVRSIQSLGGKGLVDQHELQIINDSAIFDMYQPTQYDLSDYSVTSGQGWVMDCIFQEVNLTTGELVFEWSALDHIALSESRVPPNSTNVAGTGFSSLYAWDAYHLNAVDKNQDGDYLISLRHTDTLYKVNGSTGEVIWRCGGDLSDFNFTNGLNWSRQHDARWVSYNASTDVISLFNNHGDGFTNSGTSSEGLIVQLNHDANPPTVQLLRSYPAPSGQPLSSSQGNLQILNTSDYLNSNVFINWGSQPAVTEHDSAGNILFYAYINASGPFNYRGYLANVDLSPQDDPALYTYAQSTNSDTVYYMSWNGCTQCDSYNIYGRAACDSNYTLIGNIARTGFETNYTARGYQEFGMIEAVNANGTGLRNSTARGVKAFVPSQQLSQYCNGDACQSTDQYMMVAANASASIAQTRSACAAQPVETTSTSSSGSSNTGSTTRPEMMKIATVGLISTVLLGALL